MCLFRRWSTQHCFARHRLNLRKIVAVHVRGGAGLVISSKDSRAAQSADMHTTARQFVN
jgi:hypothetical protein